MLTVTAENNDEGLEREVDGDLEAFDEWFRSLGNDPMMRSERAILKTFLFFKLKAKGPKDVAKSSE